MNLFFSDKTRSQGMTLVEMMVVVAIIGILAAIALPSYQSHIEKTNLADAKQAITGLRQSIAADKLANPADFDSETEIQTVINSRIAAFPAKLTDKYTYSGTVVANGKVFTTYFQADPVNTSGKQYFLWTDGNGNVLRCKLNGSPAAVSQTKPANCENF